ncbi:MAG TPA: YraN family protein [Feifaniaceae bacterium]|nr:YraN family protein [Feifaniaceae bacterium]
MESKREKGAYGETLALQYLEKKGYVLIARNLRIGRDEIDLVLRDGGWTVFVEVKARSSTAYGLACEAVDKRKQGRMVRAALSYLQRQPEGTSVRFDVMEVDLHTGAVRHIENAFMADVQY